MSNSAILSIRRLSEYWDWRPEKLRQIVKFFVKDPVHMNFLRYLGCASENIKAKTNFVLSLIRKMIVVKSHYRINTNTSFLIPTTLSV
jgi:hypothetical protein